MYNAHYWINSYFKVYEDFFTMFSSNLQLTVLHVYGMYPWYTF